MTTRTPDALLFDFDGVLVESTGIKTRAFAEMYAPFGESIARAAVRYHEDHGGLPRYDKFRYLHEKLLGEKPLDAARMDELDRRFSALVVDGIVAAPAVAGAEALIRRAAHSLPLFIVSGTPENELRHIVAQRGWSALFAGVYGSPEHKTGLIAGILERHGFDPEATILFGDALEDYRAARANRTGFVGRVPPGASSPFPPGVEVVPDLAAFPAAAYGLACPA